MLLEEFKQLTEASLNYQIQTPIDAKLLSAIENKINKADNIYIFRHIAPDADAIGSSLGLKLSLENKYKNKKIYICDSKTNIETLDSDVVFLLDLASVNRIDGKYRGNAFVIRIDHHPDVDIKAHLTLSNINAGSTCELITLFLFNQKYNITKEVAELLFKGIISDTGRFEYSISPTTISAVNILSSSGIDFKKIYNRMYIQDNNQIKARKFILNNYKLTTNGVAYVYIRDVDIKNNDLKTVSASALAVELSKIKNSFIWAIFVEYGGNVTASIRSRYVSIKEVAEKYSGGGHENASGVKIKSIQVPMLLSDLDTLLANTNIHEEEQKVLKSLTQTDPDYSFYTKEYTIQSSLDKLKAGDPREVYDLQRDKLLITLYKGEFIDTAKVEKTQELLSDIKHIDLLITSDVHFETINDEKIDKVVNQLNDKTTDRSVILLLGDIADSKKTTKDNIETDKKIWRKFLDQLKSKKVILIMGNNDVLPIDAYYGLGLMCVALRLETSEFIFTHRPVPVNVDKINIHGHLHGYGQYMYCDPEYHIDLSYAKYKEVFNLLELLEKYNEGYFDVGTERTDIVPGFKMNIVESGDIVKYTEKLIAKTKDTDIVFVSDTHFISVDDPKITNIAKQINNKSNHNTIVILLGDIADSKKTTKDNIETDKKIWRKFLDQLKSKKVVLVVGNNDTLSHDDYYNIGLICVADRLDEPNYILTHDPVEASSNRINIHGHIHGSRQYWHCSPEYHYDLSYKVQNDAFNLQEVFKKYNIEELGIVKEDMNLDETDRDVIYQRYKAKHHNATPEKCGHVATALFNSQKNKPKPKVSEPKHEPPKERKPFIDASYETDESMDSKTGKHRNNDD